MQFLQRHLLMLLQLLSAVLVLLPLIQSGQRVAWQGGAQLCCGLCAVLGETLQVRVKAALLSSCVAAESCLPARPAALMRPLQKPV